MNKGSACKVINLVLDFLIGKPVKYVLGVSRE